MGILEKNPSQATAAATRSRKRQGGLTAAILAASCGFGGPAAGAEGTAQDLTAQSTPERPVILPNRRWDENWSVLADPGVPREPFDGLKYIPLSHHDPKTYLSLGINLRERLEIDHSKFFGVVPGEEGEWLLSRLEAHADLRLGERVQVFAQLQSAFAPGKPVLRPVDEDRLDVEQAFVGVTERLGGGTLQVRLGRQMLVLDSQRFVSAREGPNLNLTFDAALADYERGPWRVAAVYGRPVQTRNLRAFDNYSDGRFTLSGVRLQRSLSGSAQLSAYYAHYSRDDAVFTSVIGDERRDIINVRFTGGAQGFDWDVEAMRQAGRIANQDIDAWAFGSLVGYTFPRVAWTPRLGLGVDVATGDRDPDDQTLGTFNPLFPNGLYLADYTGYANLIHLQPSVTLYPAKALNLVLGVGVQWRKTTADAVYVFPDLPVPNTAGRPGRYAGTYLELGANWALTPHNSVRVGAVHYAIGSAIRQAGGHDANYFSVQLRSVW